MAFRSSGKSIGFACAALALIASGCGDGRPKRVPVAGQVLIDGKPLSFGYIGFVPENARPSVAKLDAQGRFAMSCFEADDGVVVGKHAVEIIAREPIGEDTLKWHAPKKYASIDTSGLSEEIAAPTHSLTIRLTWDGQPGPFVEVLR
jgi:hypothetical protein